jgi:amidase
MNDPLGAFVRDNPVALQGAASGPLAGTSFAAKDVFDVAGTRTGFGQPEWLRTHPPAGATASVVQRLLDAGATLAGRTISDELCYSLSGENVHYGTPLNPKATDRIPGGSSSGSASAVAGGLVDFALGTDCGGSVRVPASYCGLYGIRTTHGRVATDGIVPFAGTFDVVGWFARDAGLLARVGEVLLDGTVDRTPLRRIIMASGLFRRTGPELGETLLRAATPLSVRFQVADFSVPPFTDLDDWRAVFQTIQASEIWANHGAWITATNPNFGPGIRERLAAAARITPDQADAARLRMENIRARIRDLIEPGTVLCLPTTPRIAPLRSTPTDDLEVAYRNQAMALLCIAGLAGLPQISLPLAEVDGVPAGLSLVGSVGADEALMAVAAGQLVPPS